MILSIMIFWIVISIRIISMIEPVWMFTFVANKVVKHWVMIIMHRSHLRMVRVELLLRIKMMLEFEWNLM